MAFLDRLRRGLGSTPTIAPAATSGASGYVVVKAETTGLRPGRDRIVELVILRLDERGSVIHEWLRRFDPEGSVGAPNVHGLVAADVVDEPLFADQVAEVAERLQGAVVVGHTIGFDLAFLRAEFERAGWTLPDLPVLDTLDLSLLRAPGLDRRRLADCCAAAGVSLRGGHSAIGDARAAAALLGSYLLDGPAPGEARLHDAAAALTWRAGPARSGALPTHGPRRPTVDTDHPTRPPAVLAELISDLSLLDLLDEGAPVASLGHVELLAESLEDGELDLDDHEGLHDLVAVHRMSPVDVAATHRALLLTLTHLALDDGLLGAAERTALSRLARFLDVDSAAIRRVVEWAAEARETRLELDLPSLPPDGTLGEALRVGDKVAFAGGDERTRDRLERRALSLGVRVVGSISTRTRVLVTEGSSAGRRSDASRLGVRQVDARTFERLLDHLQPGEERPLRPTSGRHTAGWEAPAPADPDGTDPALVRQWARDQGHAVGSRGRLSRHLVDAYLEAQPGQRIRGA